MRQRSQRVAVSCLCRSSQTNERKNDEGVGVASLSAAFDDRGRGWGGSTIGTFSKVNLAVEILGFSRGLNSFEKGQASMPGRHLIKRLLRDVRHQHTFGWLPDNEHKEGAFVGGAIQNSVKKFHWAGCMRQGCTA